MYYKRSHFFWTAILSRTTLVSFLVVLAILMTAQLSRLQKAAAPNPHSAYSSPLGDDVEIPFYR